MKRRDFLKNTLPAGIMLPSIFGGISVKAFGSSSPLLASLLMPTTDTDHVLVLVQLTGGNDGVNTVIPLEFYGNYHNARTNIAIDQSKVLSLTGTQKVGLNPAMTGMQSLFNDGKMKVINSVGYPTPSFSHFRATDIWMTAADSTQQLDSGWAGRYLNYEYPNFPNGYPNSSMTDPLSIQIGSVTSLTLQGPAVSMGMSITNPTSFYNLLNGVQDPAPNSYAGKELTFLRSMSQQTQQYATVVKAAANAVTQQSTYPTSNSLADQLKIVARLIKGGLKTRIYMVSYGGFDTHFNQTSATDTSVGSHANLLKNVSDAIKAFQDDLKFLSIENRVIGMTFSEFGRRIKSNASGGTDHGAAAPMFLFGTNILPGVLGDTPNIPANATVNDNVPFQYDFRSIYATLLTNWLCVKEADLQQVMLKNFQLLPIVNSATCKVTGPNTSGESLITNYPNPFTNSTIIKFTTAGGHTLVQVIDVMGRVIKILVDTEYPSAGTYQVTFETANLVAGVYYARFQNLSIQQVRTMVKAR
ncbi:MAG: DUF1501 domain-containing protein [Bacteroidetes bacterium]|nr:DUF1501 domain-containing protein [Bacteroidota bacterium]